MVLCAGKDKSQEGPKKIKPDLTFGLKNKGRSAKVQDRVKVLESQREMMGKNKETQSKEKEKELLKQRKLTEQRKKDEVNALFNQIDIVQPKVPFGVGQSLSLSPTHSHHSHSLPDAKTILCAFFKAGRCQKGNLFHLQLLFYSSLTLHCIGTKCKYSHDLNQERKQVKASIYADQRDEAKLEDTMDKWDDERLKEVVGLQNKNGVTTTEIVCKVSQPSYSRFHFSIF